MFRSLWPGTFACACSIVWIGCDKDAPVAPTSQPAPAPVPTTAPTSAPVVEKKPPTDLISVVLANDPDFPSTQPMREAASLEAAARLQFKEPVYLCPRGDLWITRVDAPPTQSQLKAAARQQTHAVPDGVHYVYWRPPGNGQAEIISKDEAGNDIWITRNTRAAFPTGVNRDWSRARSWNNDVTRSIVVPTSDGISICSLEEGQVDERHIKLAEPGPGVICSSVFDVRGVLAWSTSAHQASKIARFVDGKWTMLSPSPSWPARLLHTLPYADGSILAIGQEGEGLVLRSNLIEAVPIDEAKVLALVKQLADRMPEVREQAQADLANLGPAAWPTLERVQGTQPAEARVRIRAVMGDQITPTISGMKPEPGRAKLVARLRDGGVVLWMEAGVSSVGANNLVTTTAPAWLALKPAESARMVPESVWRDLRPWSAPIQSWGDEWIVEHDVDGPLRWMGNHLVPLTKQNEKMFRKFVGIDAEGRWVLKTIDPNGPTLVIDPTLLDPKPKLPVWTIDAGSKKVGWDANDWPVQEGAGFWVLKDGTWAGLKTEDVEAMHTEFAGPTTAPGTSPGQGWPLLTDESGNVYRDGLSSLTVERPDGSKMEWPLPAEAVGEGVINGKPILIEAAGKLFLFNAPGRVIRLTRQFGNAEPLKIDAVFTRHIPATDIRRIWKDPAGRVVIASRGSVLTVCFPEGMIKSNMSNMIPARALNQALEEETKDK